jgi:hypothetical protein
MKVKICTNFLGGKGQWILKGLESWAPVLMSVILATWKAEIGRVVV